MKVERQIENTEKKFSLRLHNKIKNVYESWSFPVKIRQVHQLLDFFFNLKLYIAPKDLPVLSQKTQCIFSRKQILIKWRQVSLKTTGYVVFTQAPFGFM